MEAWKLGLKSVAVYRDGSKRTQPLSTSAARAAGEEAAARRRLPDERGPSPTSSASPATKATSPWACSRTGPRANCSSSCPRRARSISGLLDSFATAVSLALQYGVPLKVFVDKFSHGRYEPSGFTNNPQIRVASSITDYIFRWLALKFLPAAEARRPIGRQPTIAVAGSRLPAPPMAPRDQAAPSRPCQMDAPPCPDCGSLMIRAGSCFRCGNCGGTSGCG